MKQNRFVKKLKNCSGATLPEYALLISLLTFGTISGVQFVGGEARDTFQTVGEALAPDQGGMSPIVVAGGPDSPIAATSNHSTNNQSTSNSASKPGKGGCEGGGTTSDECVLTSATASHQGDDGGDDGHPSGPFGGKK